MRLIGERGGRRRALFDQCRVLLSDFIHLRNRESDLLDAVALFARSLGNLGDDARHLGSN